jgi:hypothetical protein
VSDFLHTIFSSESVCPVSLNTVMLPFIIFFLNRYWRFLVPHPVLRIQILLMQIQTLLIQIRILLVTLIGSGSLPFQRGNVPKTVLFIHLNLIFLVSRSNRTQPEGMLCKFSLPVNFVVLIRVAYGSGSWNTREWIPDPQYCSNGMGWWDNFLLLYLFVNQFPWNSEARPKFFLYITSNCLLYFRGERLS